MRDYTFVMARVVQANSEQEARDLFTCELEDLKITADSFDLSDVSDEYVERELTIMESE